MNTLDNKQKQTKIILYFLMRKLLRFAETAANLYHFRTAAGQEIDFILEGPNQKTILALKNHFKKITMSFVHYFKSRMYVC